MLEIEGFQLGTVFQGATFAAVLTALLTALGIWFKYGPDRTRADNEGTVIRNAEDARQHRLWRDEVHELKNGMGKLIARQTELERLLTHALATSSMRKEQMDSMLSLIELLIDEVDRIDKKSIVVPQSRLLLKQMRAAANRKVDPFVNNPHQSPALNAAEHTVEAAEETKIAAVAAHKEVEKEEGNGK
ncbi:MAG: hypothetical protein M3R04_02370 [bacterium]|nr:hypothetical protein [bacterium]